MSLKYISSWCNFQTDPDFVFDETSSTLQLWLMIESSTDTSVCRPPWLNVTSIRKLVINRKEQRLSPLTWNTPSSMADDWITSAFCPLSTAVI